jgi:hypothetical protein
MQVGASEDKGINFTIYFSSIYLDCLGLGPFRRENPHLSLLDFLGFPWILSSESRLINGLRAIFAKRIFAAFSPLGHSKSRKGKAAGEAVRKRRILIEQA